MFLPRLFVFIFFVFMCSNSFASQIFRKGLDGQMISVEGYIEDAPRFYSSADGKSQSYSFRLNASSSRKYGDEYILVSFKTVKWGKKVGDFIYKKGDKVKLIGKYSEFRGTPKSGIVGSLAVNDKSIKEVNP